MTNYSYYDKFINKKQGIEDEYFKKYIKILVILCIKLIEFFFDHM